MEVFYIVLHTIDPTCCEYEFWIDSFLCPKKWIFSFLISTLPKKGFSIINHKIPSMSGIGYLSSREVGRCVFSDT